YQPNLGSTCRSNGPAATELCEFRERNSEPEGGANGLGDLSPTLFLSPAHPGNSFGARSGIPDADRHRSDIRSRQVGRRSIDCSADAAETLGPRASVQQYLVFRRQPRALPCESVPDAVFRDAQPGARLVSDVLADHHRKLACAGEQSMASAFWGRIWQNGAI